MNENFSLNLKFSNNSIAEEIVERNYILLSIKIIVIAVACSLNGLIIYIFLCILKTITFSNALYLTIAIGDFIIGSVAMSTQFLVDYYQGWPFGHVTCIIAVFIEYSIPDTTIFALLVLSIHRFLQLKYPFNVKEQIDCFNIFKLLISWFLTSIFWSFSIWSLIIHDQYDFILCDLNPVYQFIIVKESFINILSIALMVVFNLVLLLFLFSKYKAQNIKFKSKPQLTSILNERKTKITSENLTFNTANIQNNLKVLSARRKLNEEKKAILCVMMLICSVFFTQILYVVSWPIRQSNVFESPEMEIVYNLGMWLSYLTCVTDPIIVLIFHKKVKQRCKEMSKKLLCKCKLEK